MILDSVLLIVSFVFLYCGARWLISGATTIANCLNISKVVVGVVLVAFGTSAPELFVNIIAACKGHSGLAMSNVAGSNLANICLGYGLCAIFGCLAINRKKFGTDLLYFCLTPAVVLFFLTIFPGSKVPLWGGAVLLLLFVLYFTSIKARLYDQQGETRPSRTGLAKGVFVFLLGVSALYISGEFIVRSATNISTHFGISEAIIGLTVVAVGTSLPDITASLVAIRKGETSIAVGNILGSNIFNILLVLSATLIASWKSLPAARAVTLDYLMVVILSVFVVVITFKRQRFSPIWAGFLIGFYAVYIASRILFLN
ncbi:MAG: calcium/sodium antiporter [Anaerohalosphaeraceae bacterium]|nr:calcium/sodium antiporter [Anaerohalosphaeraceae bacterium]